LYTSAALGLGAIPLILAETDSDSSIGPVFVFILFVILAVMILRALLMAKKVGVAARAAAITLEELGDDQVRVAAPAAATAIPAIATTMVMAVAVAIAADTGADTVAVVMAAAAGIQLIQSPNPSRTVRGPVGSR
jgi:hypothetical protein